MIHVAEALVLPLFHVFGLVGSRQASFLTLRAQGAFVVSGAVDFNRILSNITIQSERGATCQFLWSPWGTGCPRVVTATGATVAVTQEVARGDVGKSVTSLIDDCPISALTLSMWTHCAALSTLNKLQPTQSPRLRFAKLIPTPLNIISVHTFQKNVMNIA